MLKFRGKLDAIEKVHLVVAILIILSIVFAIVLSVLNMDYWALFVSLGALVLALSPTLFEWRYKIDIPEELEIAAIIFIYATLFLGEVQSFYTRFWWWDVVLHIGSGIALGFVGFMILFVLHKNGKLKASPFLIVFFSFCFALAIGAFWEILEFGLGQAIGVNIQADFESNVLLDKMVDLSVDALGALIASIIGFIYIKGRKTHIVDGMIGRFVRKNPDLFKVA